MQLQTHAWESTLLSLAHEARHQSEYPVSTSFDSAVLDEAYRYCETVTAHHSRSFHMASSLLGPDARRAVRALYAFCRVSDDIVDDEADATGIRSAAMRKTQLERWRALVMTTTPPEGELVALAWTDVRLRYRIPMRYAEQLIDGVAQDLTPRRYATFEELAAYAYGVASTVGLMSMHIIGYQSNDAIPNAIKLGVALQLTNILRDVGADLRNGRVYLPQDELEAFGLCEHQMERGVVTREWREFMKFQIERNRRLYAEAMPGVGLLAAEGRFAIAAAANLYRAILRDIEAHDYDVFKRRASISTLGKLRRLPAIWWQSRTARI
ncbi:MAG: squalene/phytoene synthase family protein [Litorilinea sp.]